MKKVENHCVDCGMPCVGSFCSLDEVDVYYCDECEVEYAIYKIEGEDYCKEHASKLLKEIFDDLSLCEQAEILNINIEKID